MMTALFIIIAAIALLFSGYVFYGSWLAKQWGIDPKRKTPAQEKADGVDYVSAKPAVLMGHHFSSIAGAGPINGPIQAAVFGWVPVFLWCVIGGIFFGGLQDFGSLFASARHDGKSVGEIIRTSMGKTAKKLFIIFALLVLILVIASFVNVVAGTFFTAAPTAQTTTVSVPKKLVSPEVATVSGEITFNTSDITATSLVPFAKSLGLTDENITVADDKITVKVPDIDKFKGLFESANMKISQIVEGAKTVIKEAVYEESGKETTALEAPKAQFGIVKNPTGNQTTAMISLLFILLAIIYGILTNKCGVKTLPATIIGIAGIVVAVIIGLNYGFAMSRTAWIIVIGAYIAIASLVPVWVLLQPRDYLSSFLLYGMMALALIGIVVSAFTGNATFELPAFTGWTTKIGPMFPALFITVACGACSGFHSLISTGTTSKQLDNEKNAKAIGYGSMLIESALGIISLIAVGMVSKSFIVDGAFKGAPPVAFASGIAKMFGFTDQTNAIYALLTLAVSVFALTSLDSATRLSRFMFSELFLKDGETSYKDAKGICKLLAHPLFGTLLMVVIGCVLGGLSLSQIWGLFGAANQLLAGIALMAVAAWLGEVGKNNKMFYIPMVFMLAATLTQLIRTVIAKIQIFAGTAKAAGPMWGHWFQFVFAAAMAILAVILVVEGIKTFSKQCKKA